jgi:hypothetical protein
MSLPRIAVLATALGLLASATQSSAKEISVAAAPSAKTSETRPARGNDSGEVIKETVTRFLWVMHRQGYVVTGIVAPDGHGELILQTYCYFYLPNSDRTGRVVDIAIDGARVPNLTADLVPEPDEAVKKCQSPEKERASTPQWSEPPTLGAAAR